METLAYERIGPVGWLRLNRPDRLNAMTSTMWTELAKLGAELRDERRLRALVVIGQGRAFSSGIDVGELAGSPGPLFAEAGTGADTAPSEAEDRLLAAILAIQEAYAWLAEAPFPTIAAIRGYALGGGLQLALACDLRVVARGTKLGLPEHRYGLLPDLGGTYWLPRVVGPARAKELIFTGEPIDAEEALRIGLANRIVDDGELEKAAGALAESLAAQPPVAVRGAKRAVDEAAGQSLREALREAAIGQAACIRSADFVEAIRALGERRAPKYENR